MKTFKRLATAVLIAAMLFSSVMVMPAEAATRLSTPSNCRFVKWQSKTMTYAEVGWNSVSKANAYQAVISWADNTNKKNFYTSDTSITFTGLAVNRSYAIWDYRTLPMNFLGQICLTFSLLWIPVSLFAMVLYGLLDRKISATARKNTRFS